MRVTETTEMVLADTAEQIPEEADAAADAGEDAFGERLAAARAIWEAEADEALRKERTDTQAELAALREQIAELKRSAARRETELRCARHLRERSLDEGMVSFVLAPGETEVPDETLRLRAEALAGAVEAEAARRLREKSRSGTPAAGGAAPLSGAMIRQTPIARLAEML